MLDEAVSGRVCRLATVVGDAGLGKTRLVSELLDRESERVRILWARCLPYGEGITFWPVAEMVKAAAGIDETDSPEAARSKLENLVAAAEDGAEVAGRVSSAIGLGDGGGDIQEMFWAIRRLLEILALEIPLAVVVEDIHWAEPGLLDLLQYLARFSAGSPVFILCTSRPEIRDLRPDWSTVADTISLEPLDESECEALIANLLGRFGLTGDVRTRITDAAEGNPLFVEEMLRKLIDDGHLERENGHWTARGDLSRISVPGTINALLSARLDQLEAEERAVIQRASVVGKIFWWGAVTELSPKDDRPRVGSHLQTLLRKELVRPDRSGFAGEDAFRFSHILVRDAAYESMPKRARAELHERFASWLERKAGDRIAEFEEILGYHLEHAYRYRAELGPVDETTRAVSGRAAGHLAAAGRRALSNWDVSASVNLFSRAIDLLPAEDPMRLEILPDLGIILAQADIPRADAVLTEAVDAARAANDPLLEARAGVRRVFVRLLLDPEVNQVASLEEAERYASLFEERSDDLGLSEALNLIGLIRFWQGRAAVAEECLGRAIRHARRAGGHRQEAEGYKWLALATSIGPTPVVEGIRMLKSILEEGGQDRRVEIAVMRMSGWLEANEGRFPKARELIARAKAIANELGDQVGLTAVLRDSAAVAMLADDPVTAETELRTAYESLERMSDFGHLASFAPDLGDAVYAQGRFEEALRLSEIGEGISIEGDVDANVRWRQLRAKALAHLGRLGEAEALGVEAVRLVAATDYLDLHAHALMALAEALRLADRTTEAASSVRDALELYRRKGSLVTARRAEALLEELGGE
jgi:tetratricopeptide (TPR) repeat protein